MENPTAAQHSDPSQYLPLVRYLSVLIERYPHPTTLKQLSKSSKVSLAAVSKQRDKLFQVCDVTRLASLRRSLLLKNDFETAAKIGFTFYIDSKLGRFIRSSYAQTMIRKSVLDAHATLSEKLPGYAKFFEQDDAFFVTNLAVSIITDGLDQLQHVKMIDIDSDNLRTVIINEIVLLIDQVVPNFSQYLTDQRTLEHVLAIRDKLWYVAQEVIRSGVVQAFAQFLATLPDDSARKAYIEVYVQTSNFYLAKFLDESFTKRVRDAAHTVHANWKPTYEELGSVYTPVITPKRTGPYVLAASKSIDEEQLATRELTEKGRRDSKGREVPRIEHSSN